MVRNTRYKIILKTITPLHIGSGKELRLGFDFITGLKKTYRLDVDRLIESKADQIKPDRRGQYPLPGDLLTDEDLQNERYFRYQLSGTPKSTKSDARLKEAIKDVYDRPYIPGSSLKGAIRTALAWSVWPEVKPRVDMHRLKGALVEKEIFGKDPNHDLLKALKVSDLVTAKTASQAMRIANVSVVSGQSDKDIPIEMEVIRADHQFTGTLTIDNYLLQNPQAKAILKFDAKGAWLTNLCDHINHHSLDHAERLMNWFNNRPDCVNVYNTLEQITTALQGGRPEGQAVLQVGFGGGWDGITFGSRLQDDPQLWPAIVRKLSQKKIDPNKPQSFPSTRRAMRDPRNYTFARPLGWVLIEMIPLD